MKILKVDTSEKGGIPNTVRNLLQGGLFVVGGVLIQAGYVWWGLLLIILGAALFGLNAAHNLFENNYLIGYDAGHKEGLRSRGLPAPEEELLEGAYRVLVSTKVGDTWVVVLEDANMEGREPRIYAMKELPPAVFRKERWEDPNDPNSDKFIYGYLPLGHVT